MRTQHENYQKRLPSGKSQPDGAETFQNIWRLTQPDGWK